MFRLLAIASLVLIKYADCSNNRKNDFERTKTTNPLSKKYIPCFSLRRETGKNNNNKNCRDSSSRGLRRKEVCAIPSTCIDVPSTTSSTTSSESTQSREDNTSKSRDDKNSTYGKKDKKYLSPILPKEEKLFRELRSKSLNNGEKLTDLREEYEKNYYSSSKEGRSKSAFNNESFSKTTDDKNNIKIRDEVSSDYEFRNRRKSAERNERAGKEKNVYSGENAARSRGNRDREYYGDGIPNTRKSSNAARLRRNRDSKYFDGIPITSSSNATASRFNRETFDTVTPYASGSRRHDTESKNFARSSTTERIPDASTRSRPKPGSKNDGDSSHSTKQISDASRSESRRNRNTENFDNSIPTERILEPSSSRCNRDSKKIAHSDPIERIPDASSGGSRPSRRSKNCGDSIPHERIPDVGSRSYRNRDIKNDNDRKAAAEIIKPDKSNYEATVGKNGIKTPPRDKPVRTPGKAYKSDQTRNGTDPPPPLKVELYETENCVPDSHDEFYAKSLLYMAHYCEYDDPPVPEYEIIEEIARLFNPIVGNCEVINLKPGNYRVDTMTINSLKNYKRKRESAKTILAKSTKERVLRGISYYGKAHNYKVEIYVLPALNIKEKFPQRYILAYRSKSDKGPDYFVIQPLGYLQSHRENGKIYLHHCENLSNYLKRSDKAFWSYYSLNNG